MKEIKTTKLVEQTTVTFVADDGKEFKGEDAEYRCQMYEKKLDLPGVVQRFQDLDKTLLTIPFADYDGLETTIYLINIRNAKDLDTIMDYGSVVSYLDVSDIDYVQKHTTVYPCKKVMLITQNEFLLCNTDLYQMYVDLSISAEKVLNFYNKKEEK